jgi:lipopolysaccharide/colanic/teichoic acid biosynthesis glycosyltransferase
MKAIAISNELNLTKVKLYELIKRLIDLLLSGFALAVLTPLLIVVGILIKKDSKGPVFFVQTRIGKDGKEFKMFKFRTMIENAESFQESLKTFNERIGDGPVFKMTNDPRVTKIGNFLRKHAIDELPQLFNILFGHMSIVGPRPPVPKEVAKYQSWHLKRFQIKPGLTCYWQAQNDKSISFDDWVRSDLKYIEERSLWLDMKLILKTIPVVLFGQH